jgi:putative phosphoribosyl transferase
MFTDRQDAGRKLAMALERHRAAHPLVLGLPRGGVVVGAEVARALGGELDVMLVRKLRAPGNPELALGAVSEDGHAYVNDEVARMTGAGETYLAKELSERSREMTRQRKLYRAVRGQVPPAGRTTILVDDGLATGATMIAAIQTATLAKPASLIVAVPVGPSEEARKIGKMQQVAEFVCLETPWDFQGVGQFYYDFTQVEDETVVQILREFAAGLQSRSNQR